MAVYYNNSQGWVISILPDELKTKEDIIFLLYNLVDGDILVKLLAILINYLLPHSINNCAMEIFSYSH